MNTLRALGDVGSDNIVHKHHIPKPRGDSEPTLETTRHESDPNLVNRIKGRIALSLSNEPMEALETED